MSFNLLNLVTNTWPVYLTPPAITTLGCVLPSARKYTISRVTFHCNQYLLLFKECNGYFILSLNENECTVMNYIKDLFTSKENRCCEVHTNTQTHTHSYTHTRTYTHSRAHTHTCSKPMGINHVNGDERTCVKADNALMSHFNTY